MPVPGDHYRKDYAGGYSGVALVVDLEIVGHGAVEGQPPARAHPDIVVEVPVHAADHVRRQRGGVVGVVGEMHGSHAFGIQHREAVGIVAHVDPAVIAQHETDDRPVLHALHGVGVIVDELSARDVVFLKTAPVGAEPYIPFGVLLDMGDFPGDQGAAVRGFGNEELSMPVGIVVHRGAEALGGHPDPVGVPVRQHVVEGVAGERPRALGVAPYPDPVETVHALLGAYPHRAVAVDVHRYYIVIGKPVLSPHHLYQTLTVPSRKLLDRNHGEQEQYQKFLHDSD